MAKTQSLIFSFILLSGLFANIKAEARVYSACDAVLGENDSSFDYTGNFISYISRLLESGVLSITDLKNFVQTLEQQDVMINPLESRAKVRIDQAYHVETLQGYIDSNQLDSQKILKWAQGFLKRQEIVRSEKNESVKKTKDAVYPMRFVPVQMEGHSIEMMNTLVTKSMWAKVSPMAFDEEEVNHAIVGMTWWEVVEFANQLSIKKGLKPVYDTSKVDFNDPSGPKGLVVINAPNGDIYQAEGYRLATWEEFQWLNKKISEPVFNENYEKRKAKGWDTHFPVADIFPQNIDGRELYDLDAGLPEWMHDIAGYNGKISADRFHLHKASIRSWNNNSPGHLKDKDSKVVSFRLVRNIK